MAEPESARRATVTARAADSQPTEVPIHARDPFTVVIFGASGDLAKRKLVPALCELEKAGYLPERYAVVGFSRTHMSDDAYRAAMRTAIGSEPAGQDPKVEKLLGSLYYQAGDNDSAESFQKLGARLDAIEKER